MRTLKISEEFRVPGTNFILEKKDTILVAESEGPIKNVDLLKREAWDIANGTSNLISIINNNVSKLISSFRKYASSPGDARRQGAALEAANEAVIELQDIGVTIESRVI